MIFNRAVRREVISNASVVFAALAVIWITVILVRMLGEAAAGAVGSQAVLGLLAFSTLNALPTILVVTIFIATLITVARAYRESEMVVWFSSGLSLWDWIRPVVSVAIPIALLTALLTLLISPWAHQGISEYRVRFEKRSDIAKVTPGEFRESGGVDRVFFIESAPLDGNSVRNVFVRWVVDGRIGVILSSAGYIEDQSNGDRFLILEKGRRYDLRPGSLDLRLMDFERYGVRLERRNLSSIEELSVRTFSTRKLLLQANPVTRGELLWRIGLPIVAINLALLAIPLVFNKPRTKRSGEVMIGLLLAFLYLNLLSLAQSYVQQERLSFSIGVWIVHAFFTAVTALLFRWRV